MYRSDLNNRDRGGAVAAVVAIHAALLFAFLHLSGMNISRSAKRASDHRYDEVPAASASTASPASCAARNPRRRKAVRRPRTSRARPPRWSRRNRGSSLRPCSQSLHRKRRAREHRRRREHPTSWARNGGRRGRHRHRKRVRRGRTRGGGDGGVAEPPRLVTPVLRGRDIPSVHARSVAARATVFMRLRVDARGIVSECTVDRGTGRRRSTPRSATSRMRGFVSVLR